MTVGQLENTMSARELYEWYAIDKQAYDEQERERQNAERKDKARTKHMKIFGTDPS